MGVIDLIIQYVRIGRSLLLIPYSNPDNVNRHDLQIAMKVLPAPVLRFISGEDLNRPQKAGLVFIFGKRRAKALSANHLDFSVDLRPVNLFKIH